MSFRRTFVTGALAAAAMSSVLTASAQFGRGGADLYTPEPGARDLTSTLFNWTWSMGMLRGEAEPELILTLEYRGEGTVQVNGQACSLTEYVDAAPGELGPSGYRISANYRMPGYRTEIDCTLPNGQTYSNIETMSGEYAWDEDIAGAELILGEGTATPNPDTLEERLIRLWASPHGAPKAAIAAAAGLSTQESFAQHPATLLDRQAAAGVESMTTLVWEGNRPILTFPIPGVPGAVATATLNEIFRPESVVVTHGNNTTEFIYGNYQDFNNPYHKIEAMYPGTIVERFNGEVVRDLNAVVTEIGQGYVVVPVPNSVQAAGPATN